MVMQSNKWFRVALFVLAGLAPTIAYAGGAEVADAAQRKDLAALRTLVNTRADVNTAQADGTTALHWAVHWNDVEAAKLLLRAGANPGTKNRFGATPLSEAAFAGNAELVRALLQQYRKRFRVLDIDLAAFVLVQAVEAVIDAVALERPHLLESDRLTEELSTLVLAYLGVEPGRASKNRKRTAQTR